MTEHWQRVQPAPERPEQTDDKEKEPHSQKEQTDDKKKKLHSQKKPGTASGGRKKPAAFSKVLRQAVKKRTT